MKINSLPGLPGLRSSYNWLTARLSRVTSSGDLIPEVDGLRFIAIGIVVFHHLVSIYLPVSGRVQQIRTTADWFAAVDQSWLIPLAYCGHFGVNLFFVISGFILALPFAKRAFNDLPAPDLKSYYLRRVTRIEPPYVICLLLLFFFHWLDKGDAVSWIPNLLASIFYVHGMFYGHESVVNGVAWSLEIEIQFYLMVPLLVRIFRIRSARTRRTIMLTTMILIGLLSQWVIYPYAPAQLRMSLFNFLHYFMAGFLLADFYLNYAARESEKSWKWDVVTVISALAIVGTLLRFGHFYFLLPLVIAAMYTGCYLGRWSNAFVRLRWVVIVGGMCYTIYLYHVTIIARIFISTASWGSLARPLSLDFLLQSLIVFPLLLVICSWLFVFTEKPFMRWSLSTRRPVTVTNAIKAD
ncbi:MAG: acyltransferase family protein [Blastocatellales bacterium]